MMKAWAPPLPLDTTAWAAEHRHLARGSARLAGRYDPQLTPYMPGIVAAMDDRGIPEVVVRKSSQVGYTDGGLINHLFARVDLAPVPTIVLFPRGEDVKDFVTLKWKPAIDATKRIAALIDTSASRTTGNRTGLWTYPGGFVRLVTSKAIGSVKSTPAGLVFVEEPDDTDRDVAKQGDSIGLLRERLKTYGEDAKLIMGGTPSIEGASAIDFEYEGSDRRVFLVPCECGEAHVLDFDHLGWLEDSPFEHAQLGRARPDTAWYQCPHCGRKWDDATKNRNVRRGEWQARSPFLGRAGFFLNELYAPWQGSRLEVLVKEMLIAEHAFTKLGDESKRKVFTNSKKGITYSYSSNLPEAEQLAEHAESYQPGTVPEGGLELVGGVDCQHDRLAIKLKAVGPGEETWLVLYRELYGTVSDKGDPVWRELDQVAFAGYPREGGGALRVCALSIDSSDGQTNDAVYAWVRARQRWGVMAIKGATDRRLDAEIYSNPKHIDHRTAAKTKAAKYGLRVYMVGTQRAKDLIASRLSDRPTIARMHYYDAGEAYFTGLTAEVLAPSPRNPKKLIWTQKAGVANEPLDCEVYCLHAMRAKRLHLRTPAEWQAVRQRLSQASLFDEPAPRRAAAPGRAPRRSGGFVDNIGGS